MMRIVFAGTPDFSIPSLSALIFHSNINILGVYTKPDRPSGRGRRIKFSPVKTLALKNSIPVFQPESFEDDEETHRLKSLDADLMVVTAYGLILPDKILEIPKFGCVNIHASLLPRWRGAAPVQRAIQANDTQTGVTIIRMETGLDNGPILAQEKILILEHDTGGSLCKKLALLGGKMLKTNINAIVNQSLRSKQQNETEACYADKLVKSESIIDWRENALSLQRKIRAFNPWPIVSAELVDGLKLRLYKSRVYKNSTKIGQVGEILTVDRKKILVQTGFGSLSIQGLQIPGKNPITVEDFINGFTIKPGMRFNVKT